MTEEDITQEFRLKQIDEKIKKVTLKRNKRK